MAERLQSAVRQTDIVARIGGDEFLIVLPRTRIAEGHMLAERARLAIASQPIFASDERVPTTVSVGVARLDWGTSTIEEILTLTRMALESSKASGKNRVVGDEASRQLHSLIKGLVTGEGIRPQAQPIIRLSDQAVVGYELLSRGPVGPFSAPLQFLRVARDRRVITAVDLQCLRACLGASQGLPSGSSIHVNLLPTTLLDVPLDELDRLFESVRHHALCLELSEDQFIGDPKELIDRIDRLKEAGVRLAIDDLGRGRGTLESVMLLDPEIAKIDRALVDGASSDHRKERLLRRLVSLTRVLDCQVIAEGVEQAADAALLASLGVQFGQGFIWSPPVEVADAPQGALIARPAPTDAEVIDLESARKRREDR